MDGESCSRNVSEVESVAEQACGRRRVDVTMPVNRGLSLDKLNIVRALNVCCRGGLHTEPGCTHAVKVGRRPAGRRAQ